MVQQYIIPDLIALCPLKFGSTNPYYQEAAAESRAWINSYDVFTDRMRAFFIHESNELLVSHTYPYAGYEQFRTCCDLINLLFVIDDISDDLRGEGASATCEVCLRAMCDPNWGDNSPLSKIIKEFRARFMRLASPNTSRRFFLLWKHYLDATSKEAELRDRKEVLNLAAFIPLRRDNSAMRLVFALSEYALGIDIPDEVFENEIFQSIYTAAADMVCCANDVYSYNDEQSRNHSGNNIVTVLRNERNIDIQAACNHVGVHFKELMDRFMADKERLPSFGPNLDGSVARYVGAMGGWVVGNLEWSFETIRYFGVDHAEVKKSRVVTLLPGGKAPPEFDSEDSSDW